MAKEKLAPKSSAGNQCASRFVRPARYDRTPILCRLIFAYVFPTFWRGWQNAGLRQDDIDHCPVDDESERVTYSLQKNWEQAKQRASDAAARAAKLAKSNRKTSPPKSAPKPDFVWIMFKTFICAYKTPFIVYLFEECVLRVVQPLLLAKVIRYFAGDRSISYEFACVCAGGVCACTLAFVSMHHPTMQYVMRLGMRLRVACCALMYQKAVRLSRASVGETAVGQIVNIMSNDVNRLDEFVIFAAYLVVAPIQATAIVYIVWTYLGVSCLAGVSLLILFIPFQALMGRLFSGVRLRTAILTDTRLRYMSEIISGMRVIKMYSWERPFARRVADARKSEVSQVRKGMSLKAINLSMFFVASRIILFVCFVIFVLLGHDLTAEAVFVSMALFNTLRLLMTFMFPNAIGLASELMVTLKRIEKFLLLEEISNVNDNNAMNGVKNGADSTATPVVTAANLIVNNITAKWSPDVMQPTLKDVSMKLKSGELLAVIGPVGSGKSSLLMSILRELPLESGKIEIDGRLSYASQDAWSYNDSVRSNILFGMPFDEAKYDRVIEVCALRRDLALMPAGDRTLVGEKGVSLSGGQKARINLARAVYRDADICLLDDPLSAVDSAVAEHIFEQCIVSHLRDKIRVLVTHQMQFIEKANKILILRDGRCLAYGSFREIQELGIDFMSLLQTKSDANESDGKRGGGGASGDSSGPDESADLASQYSLERCNSTQSVSSDALKGRSRTLSHATVESFEVPEADDYNDGNEDGNRRNVRNQNDKSPEPANSTKIEEEQFQRGSIKGAVYYQYIRAGAGPVMFAVTVAFTAISQTLFHGSDIFLTYWTDKNQLQNNSTIKISAYNDTTNEAEIDPNHHRDIWIYTALISALFVSTFLRSFTFFAICMRASVRLHKQIFDRLLRAPVSFFDQNPAGRILNRFTKDLGIIDESMPITAFDLNLTLLQAFGIIITVSVVNWYLILPALFLTAIVVFIRGIYIKSARDIKRYEGLARSPVYSHISTTINGLTSIRAYGAQRSFEKQFYAYQNDHTATWFLFISASRAMGLMMDWISTIYIVIITATVMLSDNMKGGFAGLAISSGLMLAGMTQWGVRQSAEFESQMTSVERIVEYQSLPQEAAAESKRELKPFPEWPTSGEIVFDRMNLAYSVAAKPVLRNIVCTILGGEKIGIVGRTGAGKSSMIAALFRLTEPCAGGTIRIDGVDICSIGLDDLRRKVSIIPQDPVVFSGTVRYNLDPFGEYPDEDLWQALAEVQLKAQIENYAGKLDARLSESGGNLSVGQRQLICLARAILRRNTILVLDEATANVDHETDALIQQTIRSEFAHCTVLTIAHRLNTIIDCDRVMVLDAGEIVEFDSPYSLLRRRNMFYDMCKKTGPTMFTHLYQIARKTHQARQPKLLETTNMDGDAEEIVEQIDENFDDDEQSEIKRKNDDEQKQISNATRL